MARLGSADGSLRRAIDTDTLVVGAGPQSLTVLARWLCDRPASVNGIVVVDPAGSWMHAWDAAFDRQQIDVLRSPGVHHPDPDEMAFVRAHEHSCTRARRSAADRRDAMKGPLRRPTTDAFKRFCWDLIRQASLSQRVVPATVVALRPAIDGASDVRWSAQLSDGATVHARQVVWAGNPRFRRSPGGVELCDAIVHSDSADLTTVLPGQRIAILGGGQTAGQLALRAARRGADVTLISREPQRVADLDVDASWLMDDRLVPFRSIADPVERRRVVEQARRGSMTADLVRALDRASVCRLSGAGELAARPDGDGAVVGLVGAELHVDTVWTATGSVPDLRADRALAQLPAAGAPHVDGWPILDDQLRWRDGLFVVGALAALTLGPAAGNLGGARAAADLLAAHAPTSARADRTCKADAPRARPAALARDHADTSSSSV